MRKSAFKSKEKFDAILPKLVIGLDGLEYP